MIIKKLEDRIDALTPEGKKLLLRKIKEAVAVKGVKTNSSDSKRIVAYIQSENNFSSEELKLYLKDKLPVYMVPSQFIQVTKMPLLPNGKIDRKQLQNLTLKKEATAKKEKTSTSKNNNLEEQLITIWEETLGFSPIRKDDNFFEIGGDSILSIQIVAKARKYGITLKSNDLFEQQTISELALVAKTENAKNTSVEERLIKIWEETLGFSPIHKDDNFFEIGGDSILSIQIIAKARKNGIFLKANDIFEYQTIKELSLFAKQDAKENKNSEIINGVVALSPIQHWFFNDHKNAPEYWNQAVRLDNLPKLSEEKIANICNYIVKQHDMLRAKFTNTNGKWIQEILKPEEVCALEYIDVSNFNETELKDNIEKVLKHTQQQFNLSKGSLFKCIYFGNQTEKQDFCVLLAHHLVVDAVSWQIITEDFTNAIQTLVSNKEIERETKTSSFKDWTNYVSAYSENILETELAFWQDQISNVLKLPLDIENASTIEEKDISYLDFSFDEKTTQKIIKANEAYNTRTDELLIAAFVEAVGKWSLKSEITIGFERHGRETEATKLDLSKTVGWFTSYFPLKFTYLADNLIDAKIITVKEKIRNIPKGGIGFGSLRYIKNTFGAIDNPEIVFNYLGTQKSMQSGNTIKITTLTSGLRDERSERNYKIEVNAVILDGVLKASLGFASNLYYKETMVSLMNDFENQIKIICDNCNTSENSRYTPSDFSDAEISQDDLDNLLNTLS